MREICTSGSVGGPVGQPAGSTRLAQGPISIPIPARRPPAVAHPLCEKGQAGEQGGVREIAEFHGGFPLPE